MTSSTVILRKWLPFAALSTILCAISFLVLQQEMRQSMNDLPAGMAYEAAARLESGATPDSVLQGEPDNSLSFLSIVDDSLNPVGAVEPAYYHDLSLVLPKGVYDYVRTHGEDRITWQTKTGLRFATVTVHTTTQPMYFVTAGQPLTEIEARKARLLVEMGVAWAVSLVVTFALVAI